MLVQEGGVIPQGKPPHATTLLVGSSGLGADFYQQRSNLSGEDGQFSITEFAIIKQYYNSPLIVELREKEIAKQVAAQVEEITSGIQADAKMERDRFEEEKNLAIAVAREEAKNLMLQTGGTSGPNFLTNMMNTKIMGMPSIVVYGGGAALLAYLLMGGKK